MKKSNAASKSAFSGNIFIFVFAMFLLIVMATVSLPAPPAQVAFSSVAFALQAGEDPGGQILSIMDNNQIGQNDHYSDGSLGNLISQQQSPQADARNINVDDKVIIVEDCDDSEIVINDNDQIIQANTQSFTEEANIHVSEEEDEDDEGGHGDDSS